jgi:hypothetical protein
MTTDRDIHGTITALIAEEKKLREQLQRDEISPEEEQRRLREVEVQLDQCWDLLRQRGARRDADDDPDAAEVRSADVVEHYDQ